MVTIHKKTDPKLFDKAVLEIQNALADGLPWLDNVFGICETLIDMKGSRKFVSANHYIGNGQYEQIMPCEELGNFAFFSLKDPQDTNLKDKMLVKCPFSLVLWYDMRKVSLPTDERNTEAIKAQILGIMHNIHNPYFVMTRIYEKPQNVFAEYTYDIVANQYLTSPFAGMRIDGYLEVRVPCVPSRLEIGDSYNSDFENSFDR